VKDLSEKFIELYWQQCRPFELGGEKTGLVLLQNTGTQAAIIRKIITAQEDFGGSLCRLKQTAPDLWISLRSDVKRTVNEMPLWKLQTVGNERMDFLYDNLDKSTTTITLKPGVAFCFRAFYGLMRDLIQGAWVRFVQRLNANDLGNLTDLGTFMFDRERSSLESYRNILIELQERRCFYCDQELKGKSDVDHFVPWSRYPTDLGHNFVVAHPQCNNSKSDFLGAELHLERWAQRNILKSAELCQRLNDAGLPNDLQASKRIAEWAYDQVEKSKGQVWLFSHHFEHLGFGWRELLAG
jgi:5-methylcytosine-specific restriction endonuclease McrA